MSGDRINWATGQPIETFAAYAQWDGAVGRASEGDANPLIALLRSETPLGPDARDLIAELLSYRQLKRIRGGRVNPGRITLTEGRLQKQAALFRFWKRKGLPHEDAMRAALRDYKREETVNRGKLVAPPTDEELDNMITEAEINRLENLVLGKRGSSRRINKRRSG